MSSLFPILHLQCLCLLFRFCAFMCFFLLLQHPASLWNPLNFDSSAEAFGRLGKRYRFITFLFLIVCFDYVCDSLYNCGFSLSVSRPMSCHASLFAFSMACCTSELGASFTDRIWKVSDRSVKLRATFYERSRDLQSDRRPCFMILFSRLPECINGRKPVSWLSRAICSFASPVLFRVCQLFLQLASRRVSGNIFLQFPRACLQ